MPLTELRDSLGQLIFWSIVFGMVLCVALLFDCGCPSGKTHLEQQPVTIVYQDDCYMDDDYKLEIISAKETERLLKNIK